MQTKLYRKIDSKHIRYYFIELQKTLFGDYIVERIYGNLLNRAPTGKRINYFNTKEEAEKFFNKTINKKQKKGYSFERY